MRTSIEDTRKGFEESFASGEFYNRQTQDSDHMEKILRFVKIRGRMRILDLGTGSGYLAFPMAKNNPDSEVIGLDIVSDARIIMEALLLEAKKMEISVIELKATGDGYPLYCSVGFMEDVSKYHLMKWKNKWRNIK